MPNRLLSLNHPDSESALLYDILDSISEAVIVFDDAGNALYSNHAAKQKLDIPTVQADSTTWNLSPQLFFPDGLTPYPIPELPCFADRANEEDIPLVMRLNGQSPIAVKVRGQRFISLPGRRYAWLTLGPHPASAPQDTVKPESKLSAPPMQPLPLAMKAESLDSQQNLRALLNQMPAMIGYWDSNLINRFGNKAYEQWFGYTPDNLIGKHIRAVIGDQLYNLNKPHINAVLAGKPQFFERAIVNYAGETRHTQTSYLPDCNSDQVLGFFVLVTDITDLKIAQKRSSESEAILRAMFDSLPFLAWIKDTDGKYLQVNKHWLKAVGIGKFNDVGQTTDFDIWPENLARHYRKVDQEVMLTRRQISLTEKAFDGGLETRTETIKAPIIDEHNEVHGTIGLARDITESRSAEEKLRDYGKRLELATRAAAIGVCEWDLAAGLADWDARMYQIFGVPEGDTIDYQTWLTLVLPDDVSQVESKLRKLFKRRREQHWEFRIRRQCDGALRFIRATAIIVEDAEGKAKKVVGVILDVTSFKLIEIALRDSEAHLAQAQAQAHLGSWSLAAGEDHLKWSDENYRIYGIPLGTPISYEYYLNCIHPDDRSLVKDAWAAAMQRHNYDIQLRIIANGEVKWLNERAELEFTDDGKFVGCIGTSQDITELKQIEKSLESSRLQLRQLAARREQAREDERKRIAREVHDELGQMLSALRLEMSLLQMQFAGAHSVLSNKIRDIKALLDKTIQVTRDLATSLRPSVIEMGVVPALEWLVKKFSEQSGIECHLDFPEDNFKMGEKCSIAMFRIAQESLTNVLRHANASQVKVSIKVDNTHYRLEIGDNGQGFDATGPHKSQSFGLIGIQERCLILGGEMTIVSSPGNGTIIKVQIPVKTKRQVP